MHYEKIPLKFMNKIKNRTLCKIRKESGSRLVSLALCAEAGAGGE
jgi:hypothetical protein